MRIAKSSKEQDGYEARDTTGARLSPGPEGRPDATSEVAPNELAKPVLVSRGSIKIFEAQTGAPLRRGSAYSGRAQT